MFNKKNKKVEAIKEKAYFFGSFIAFLLATLVVLCFNNTRINLIVTFGGSSIIMFYFFIKRRLK